MRNESDPLSEAQVQVWSWDADRGARSLTHQRLRLCPTRVKPFTLHPALCPPHKPASYGQGMTLIQIFSHHNARFIAILRPVCCCCCWVKTDPIPCMGWDFLRELKGWPHCPNFECIFLKFQSALSQFRGWLVQRSTGSMVTAEELGVKQ